MNFATSFRAFRPFSNARADRRTERGWALVSALWAITMLALMAAATEALTAMSYRAEAHAITAAKADAALDAAVVRAVLGICDVRPQSRWRVDGGHRQFWFEGIRVDVSVQGELGRIDVNAASGALIRQLLAGNGVSPEAATQLTDRILAWRSATGLEGLKGTDNDYADLSYRPRHGPFQTVDEVGLVLGMTPALFAKIAPAITIYSKRPTFDQSIAPPEAIRALYPNDDRKIDDILRLRDRTADSGSGAGALPGAPAFQNAMSGQGFSITATATIGSRTFQRAAVVELTGSESRRYYVLSWR